MSLTISEEVKQRLAPFLTETNTFLLVANDGSNPYSSAEGCCMIGDRFIIVPVDQLSYLTEQDFLRLVLFFFAKYGVIFVAPCFDKRYFWL